MGAAAAHRADMTVARPRLRVAQTWVLGALLLGFPTDAWALLPEDCERLGGALVDHSCFHSKYGPFVSMQATSDGATAPDVDPVHTEYRLGLSGEQSVVTYSPLRAGAWSIFLSDDVPLTVVDAEARELDRVLSINGNTGCEALPISHVYELFDRKRYQLRFGATAAREVVIVIEYVDDFLTANGRDADGDGYGRGDDVVTTSCAPPQGYAPNASDCDDEDPDISPGRAEDCDGIDQNCNGVVDDVGLSCWNGENACRATGVWSCGSGGVRAACDATPLRGSDEICNGIDDDCNGSIDDGEGLCSDPERPVCARHDRTASCGCLLDTDCGPRESGRVCDAPKRRCVSGCSNDPGRNGCPRGFECIAADGDAFCEPEQPAPPPSGVGGEAPAPDDGDEPAPLDSQAVGCGCRLAGSRPARNDVPLFGVLCALAAFRSRRARSSRRGAPRAAHTASLPFLILTLLAGGCGGVAESDPERRPGHESAGSAPCEPALEEKPVAHACVHTTNGPFKDVVASAETGVMGDVSELHHTFVVDSVAAESFLLYEAQRGGEHVLMTNRSVALRVVDASSRSVSGEAFEVKGCETIAEARTAALEKGRAYRIEVEHGAPRLFDLFIEHLGAFRDPWARSCSQ
jgi:hypothetical protein